MSTNIVSDGTYKRLSAFTCAGCEAPISNAILAKKGTSRKTNNIFCNRKCYDSARSLIIAKRIASCSFCGSSVSVGKKRSKIEGNIYCSHSCRVIAKKPKPKNCIQCGCYFSSIKFNKKTGKFIAVTDAKTCSHQCHIEKIKTDQNRKEKISFAFSGPKHPNWKGGVSHQRIGHRGSGWSKQRSAALERDKNQCVDCGMTSKESLIRYGCDLHVDHIVPFHNFGNYLEANKLNNLASRCASCHKKEESKRGMCQMVLDFAKTGERRKGHSTSKQAGQAHHKARLTDSLVMHLRLNFAEMEVTITEVAKTHGVSIGAVSLALKGKTWKHLPMPGK